ncbi:MAG: V-type ATPase subunit [Promethearchaeota archaeon]
MRTSIDDYGYVFIKLSVLKSLLMNNEDFKKLRAFTDLDSLASFTRRFFPNFSAADYKIIDFERSLWKTYINIEEKILLASPEPVRIFLKSMMVRYEIWNIKYAIHGIIEKQDLEEKYKHIFKKPSVILERQKFISKLIKAKNFNDLRKAVKHTPYEKLMERGITKYEETGDIFYLEQELDKYFFDNLIDKSAFFPRREKRFMEKFIRSQIDFYNLNLLYRTFYNNINIGVIRPYLIYTGFLLRRKELQKLLWAKDFHDFVDRLEVLLKEEKEMKYIIHELHDPNPHLWKNLSAIFMDKFLIRYREKIIQDIPLQSISLIFQILLIKPMEIQEIIAQSVEISLVA